MNFKATAHMSREKQGFFDWRLDAERGRIFRNKCLSQSQCILCPAYVMILEGTVPVHSCCFDFLEIMELIGLEGTQVSSGLTLCTSAGMVPLNSLYLTLIQPPPENVQ